MELDIVASIFFGIIAVEGRAEQERLKLDNYNNYDPYMAFEYLRQFRFNRQITMDNQDIDDQKNHLLPVKLIEDFLGYFKVQAKSQEISQTINMFSSSPHRSLDIQNFLALTKPIQKLEKSYRKIFDLKNEKKYPNKEILLSIAKIFEIELNLVRHTDKQKQKLQQQMKSNIENIFQQIDYQSKGFLDYNSVESLMKGSGRPFSRRDYDALVRRVKRQASVSDDSVYFGEFVKCVTNDLDVNLVDNEEVYDYSQRSNQKLFQQPQSSQVSQINISQSRLNIENEYQQMILQNQKIPNFTVGGEKIYMNDDNHNKKYPTIPTLPSQSKGINQAFQNIFQESQIDKTQLMGNPLFYQQIPGTHEQFQQVKGKQQQQNFKVFSDSFIQNNQYPEQNNSAYIQQQLIGQSIRPQQMIGMGQSVSPPSFYQNKFVYQSQNR